MEANLTQLTRQVPITVQDTVMLSALKILSSLMDKPMSSDGIHHQVILMLERENGELAALRWISGKPTLSQVPSLLILAPMMASGDARTKLTVETLTDTKVFAIKMVAILMHTELVLQISSGLDLVLRLILPSQ